MRKPIDLDKSNSELQTLIEAKLALEMSAKKINTDGSLLEVLQDIQELRKSLNVIKESTTYLSDSLKK